MENHHRLQLRCPSLDFAIHAGAVQEEGKTHFGPLPTLYHVSLTFTYFYVMSCVYNQVHGGLSSMITDFNLANFSCPHDSEICDPRLSNFNAKVAGLTIFLPVLCNLW